MKHKRLRFTHVILGFCASVLLASSVQAQITWESERINANIGATLSVPVGSTAHPVENNPGLVAGMGYNFSPRHSLIGEFMWNGLNPRNGGLQPIRACGTLHYGHTCGNLLGQDGAPGRWYRE